MLSLRSYVNNKIVTFMVIFLVFLLSFFFSESKFDLYQYVFIFYFITATSHFLIGGYFQINSFYRSSKIKKNYLFFSIFLLLPIFIWPFIYPHISHFLFFIFLLIYFLIHGFLGERFIQKDKSFKYIDIFVLFLVWILFKSISDIDGLNMYLTYLSSTTIDLWQSSNQVFILKGISLLFDFLFFFIILFGIIYLFISKYKFNRKSSIFFLFLNLLFLFSIFKFNNFSFILSSLIIITSHFISWNFYEIKKYDLLGNRLNYHKLIFILISIHLFLFLVYFFKFNFLYSFFFSPQIFLFLTFSHITMGFFNESWLIKYLK